MHMQRSLKPPWRILQQLLTSTKRCHHSLKHSKPENLQSLVDFSIPKQNRNLATTLPRSSANTEKVKSTLTVKNDRILCNEQFADHKHIFQTQTYLSNNMAITNSICQIKRLQNEQTQNKPIQKSNRLYFSKKLYKYKGLWPKSHYFNYSKFGS